MYVSLKWKFKVSFHDKYVYANVVYWKLNFKLKTNTFATSEEIVNRCISIWDRENLYNREGQTDSTPVDEYHFTWTTKGVRCNPKFQFSFM